jgi:hypothetical protein
MTRSAARRSRTLSRLALLYIAIALSNQVFVAWAKYLGETIAGPPRMRCGRPGEHCLALDQSFHKERTPGEMVERIDAT